MGQGKRPFARPQVVTFLSLQHALHSLRVMTKYKL